MPFEKGQSGNAKGRPKGSNNKLQQEARELFIETLEGQVGNIDEAFKKVYDKNPAKFLELFAKYAQYFVPKKTETDLKGDLKTDINFADIIEFVSGKDK